MDIWTDADLAFVRERAHSWDLHYSELFWGARLYDLVEPLLASFNADCGVPKQIGVASESLPETTATVLLALHRMGLLSASMRERVQGYLWSTHYAVAAGTVGDSKYPENECWSSTSRNVWATASTLWALIATGYRGPHEGRYAAAVRWLVDAQDDDGAWGFSRDARNPPSVFLTAVCAYTLHLAAGSAGPGAQRIDQALVRTAVDAGTGYLKRTRHRRSGLWHTSGGEPEPTSTAMALWAVRWCDTAGADTGDLLRNGLRALSRAVGGALCGPSLEIAVGTLPDSREAIALQGYTPALPLALLQLDIDPFHRLVVGPLTFLRTSRQPNGWEFPVIGNERQGRYIKAVPYVGTGEPLTFTTALALQTAHAWHRRTIRWTIEQRLTHG
ncbi:hypothetical protein [Streptomyces sp. NBC_01477]|uniref:hypothetical protein n=1 Tax=Streptomyces sp. NBC_01477 TaxID=2976015 RepID=UPI002E32B83E|nr:hypothetical protein [Streptomyces sp. NBC_01477]